MTDKAISLLRPMETQNLHWNNSFTFPNMIRIGTYADGSCLFHSIAMAYYQPYIMGRNKDKPIDRIDFIKNLRKELADRLGDKADPNDPKSPSYYETISRGGLPNFGKEISHYSLGSMQQELSSSKPVDNVYNEFISDVLNKDIYILDMTSKDVYMTGDDLDILYKNRNSIVILYLPGHYELVGLKNSKGEISTLFTHDHPFIQTIQNRMMEKIS